MVQLNTQSLCNKSISTSIYESEFFLYSSYVQKIRRKSISLIIQIYVWRFWITVITIERRKRLQRALKDLWCQDLEGNASRGIKWNGTPHIVGVARRIAVVASWNSGSFGRTVTSKKVGCWPSWLYNPPSIHSLSIRKHTRFQSHTTRTTNVSL